MTSAPEKPTMVLVHGAWHAPAHLAPAAPLFEAAGYPTICTCLLSPGANPPTTSMHDDAAALRAALDRLIISDGKEVVLVLHSYGGIVGTQAAHASLGKEARAQRGLPGGILVLVYVAAFVLSEGASLFSTFGGPPQYLAIEKDGSCTMQDPASHFYHDVPAAEQARWVSLLKPQPISTFTTEQTYLGYAHHPAAYIMCEADRAVPIEVQETMVAGMGPGVKVERLQSAHSPFLSMPEKFFETVLKLAGV